MIPLAVQWVFRVPSLRRPPVGMAISVKTSAISSGEPPLTRVAYIHRTTRASLSLMASTFFLPPKPSGTSILS